MRPLTFMGIENEFIPYRRGGDVNMSEAWDDLLARYPHPYFEKTDTCIRTYIGNALYIDGSEPETCTPPILVERGFATKMGDALYMARRDLVEFIAGDKHINLVGYSMHWNITRPATIPEQDWKRGKTLNRIFGVPWQLFGITPNSVGSSIRHKSEKRIEFLGDHLPGEEQATAFALIYAGMVLGHHDHHAPYALPNIGGGGWNETIKNLVKNGRDARIQVVSEPTQLDLARSGIAGQLPPDKEVTAQEYLETTVFHFYDIIQDLATRDEWRLLQRFLSGKSELEVDKQAKYAAMRKHEDNNDGYYDHPTVRFDKGAYAAPRIVTPMAQFLGAIAHQDLPRPPPPGMDWFPEEIETMEWDDIDMETHHIQGLDRMQIIAEMARPLGDVKAVHKAIAAIDDVLISERTYQKMASIREPVVMHRGKFHREFAGIYHLAKTEAKDPDDASMVTVSANSYGKAFLRALDRLYFKRDTRRPEWDPNTIDVAVKDSARPDAATTPEARGPIVSNAYNLDAIANSAENLTDVTSDRTALPEHRPQSATHISDVIDISPQGRITSRYRITDPEMREAVIDAITALYAEIGSPRRDE